MNPKNPLKISYENIIFTFPYWIKEEIPTKTPLIYIHIQNKQISENNYSTIIQIPIELSGISRLFYCIKEILYRLTTNPMKEQPNASLAYIPLKIRQEDWANGYWIDKINFKKIPDIKEFK